MLPAVVVLGFVLVLGEVVVVAAAAAGVVLVLVVVVVVVVFVVVVVVRVVVVVVVAAAVAVVLGVILWSPVLLQRRLLLVVVWCCCDCNATVVCESCCQTPDCRCCAHDHGTTKPRLADLVSRLETEARLFEASEFRVRSGFCTSR